MWRAEPNGHGAQYLRVSSSTLKYISGGESGWAGEAREKRGHRVGDAVSQELLK